jgi:Deoxynucleoside kinase
MTDILCKWFVGIPSESIEERNTIESALEYKTLELQTEPILLPIFNEHLSGHNILSLVGSNQIAEVDPITLTDYRDKIFFNNNILRLVRRDVGKYSFEDIRSTYQDRQAHLYQSLNYASEIGKAYHEASGRYEAVVNSSEKEEWEKIQSGCDFARDMQGIIEAMLSFFVIPKEANYKRKTLAHISEQVLDRKNPTNDAFSQKGEIEKATNQFWQYAQRLRQIHYVTTPVTTTEWFSKPSLLIGDKIDHKSMPEFIGRAFWSTMYEKDTNIPRYVVSRDGSNCTRATVQKCMMRYTNRFNSYEVSSALTKITEDPANPTMNDLLDEHWLNWICNYEKCGEKSEHWKPSFLVWNERSHEDSLTTNYVMRVVEYDVINREFMERLTKESKTKFHISLLSPSGGKLLKSYLENDMKFPKLEEFKTRTKPYPSNINTEVRFAHVPKQSAKVLEFLMECKYNLTVEGIVGSAKSTTTNILQKAHPWGVVVLSEPSQSWYKYLYQLEQLPTRDHAQIRDILTANVQPQIAEAYFSSSQITLDMYKEEIAATKQPVVIERSMIMSGMMFMPTVITMDHLVTNLGLMKKINYLNQLDSCNVIICSNIGEIIEGRIKRRNKPGDICYSSEDFKNQMKCIISGSAAIADVYHEHFGMFFIPSDSDDHKDDHSESLVVSNIFSNTAVEPHHSSWIRSDFSAMFPGMYETYNDDRNFWYRVKQDYWSSLADRGPYSYVTETHRRRLLSCTENHHTSTQTFSKIHQEHGVQFAKPYLVFGNIANGATGVFSDVQRSALLKNYYKNNYKGRSEESPIVKICASKIRERLHCAFLNKPWKQRPCPWDRSDFGISSVATYLDQAFLSELDFNRIVDSKQIIDNVIKTGAERLEEDATKEEREAIDGAIELLCERLITRMSICEFRHFYCATLGTTVSPKTLRHGMFELLMLSIMPPYVEACPEHPINILMSTNKYAIHRFSCMPINFKNMCDAIFAYAAKDDTPTYPSELAQDKEEIPKNPYHYLFVKMNRFNYSRMAQLVRSLKPIQNLPMPNPMALIVNKKNFPPDVKDEIIGLVDSKIWKLGHVPIKYCADKNPFLLYPAATP